MTEDVEPRTNVNAEIAGLFAEIGDILEVKGEQPFATTRTASPPAASAARASASTCCSRRVACAS